MRPDRATLAWLAKLFALVLLAYLPFSHTVRRAFADAPTLTPLAAGVQAVPDQMLVKVAPDTAPPTGADPIPFLTVDNGRWYVVHTAPDRLGTLAATPGVLAVQPNGLMSVDPILPSDSLSPSPYPLAPVSDPLFGSQYGLQKMQVPAAWDRTDGAGVTVYVLDTGVWRDHPDFQRDGRSIVVSGPDYAAGDNDASDVHGHGTHVAGTVGAVRNSIGVAGTANVKIVAVRVLGDNGSGQYDWIARGIQWAADQPDPRKVVSMSLGGPGAVGAIADAVAYARAHNTLVVAAAGNASTDAPQSPAMYADLRVGATDQANKLASFSNFGPTNLNLVAPGVSIISTVMTRGGSMSDPSGYREASGTSMATPHMSGVAALAWAAHPGLSSVQVADLLKSTATNLGDTRYYGAGLVNAAAAVGNDSPPPINPTPYPTPRNPTPYPTTTPTPDPYPSYSRRVFELVNAERVKNGLGALPWSAPLARAANGHNLAMDRCAQAGGASCFAHQLPGEPDPNQRARAAGWQGLYVLEDIGRGYDTPESVVNGWMNSAGHRAAILSTRATEIGADYYDGLGGYLGRWWSLEMGVGSTVAPTPTPIRTLPRGYTMTVVYDYDRLTAAVVDTAYWQGVAPYLGRGVTARWTRKSPWLPQPPALPGQLLPDWIMTITLDYNVVSVEAADLNYSLAHPYEGQGVSMTWKRDH